jgi:hypothetical protein
MRIVTELRTRRTFSGRTRGNTDVLDAEEQLNQEWWAAQDSDDDWIASHEEKHDGYDAVCR